MAKFVWCTIGTNLREMHAAKAVIVEAKDREAAKLKVLADMAFAEDPEEHEILKEDCLESYGSEWFLQDLADETL